MLRRHTDGGDEQLRAGIDNDADQLVELALRVIVAVGRLIVSNRVG